MATAPSALHLTAGFDRPAQCPRALHSRRTSHAHASTRAGSSASDDVYLLDYGAGNVRSVRNAVKRLGYNLKEVEAGFRDQRGTSYVFSPTANLWHLICLQVQNVDDISAASRLIFPGVGAYGQAMDRLKYLGYVEALKDYIQVAEST